MRRIGICFTIWHKRSDVFLHTKHGRERGRRGREAGVGGIAERQNDEEGREVLPQGLHLFRTGAIIVPEMPASHAPAVSGSSGPVQRRSLHYLILQPSSSSIYRTIVIGHQQYGSSCERVVQGEAR